MGKANFSDDFKRDAVAQIFVGQRRRKQAMHMHLGPASPAFQFTDQIVASNRGYALKVP